MKHLKFNKMAMVAALMCLPFLFFSCKKDNPKQPTSKINYHFATLTEGQQLLDANLEFYNSMNQNNIDWRMRQSGATLAELKAFAQTCVRDFTDEEKAALAKAVAEIEGKLNAMGAALPFPDDIAFVRTTMEEEGNAGAYTHKTQIYVGERILKKAYRKTATTKPQQKAIGCISIMSLPTSCSIASRATRPSSAAKCTAS